MVDGLQNEGTFRSHQVPLLVDAEHPEHLQQLEELDEELQGRGAVRARMAGLMPELAELAPKGRAGAWAPIPTRTVGPLLQDLRMPDFRAQGRARCPHPARVESGKIRLSWASSCGT